MKDLKKDANPTSGGEMGWVGPFPFAKFALTGYLLSHLVK